MDSEKIKAKISNLDRLLREVQDIDLLNKELARVEKEIENGYEPDSLFGIAFNNSKYIDKPCKFALNGPTSYPEVSLAVITLVCSATQKRRKEIEKIINEEHGGINDDE